MDQQGHYPLNAAGDFYVVDQLCIACTAVGHETPDVGARDPETHAGYHGYLKRQPETAEGLQRDVMGGRSAAPSFIRPTCPPWPSGCWA